MILLIIRGIYENFNNGIGLSSINMDSCVISLLQFYDDFCYRKLVKKLLMFNPTEVIISNKNLKLSILQKILKNEFESLKITVINSRYFDKQKGFELFNKHISKDVDNSINTSNRLTCQASLSALVMFLEIERNIYLKPFELSIEYQNNDDGMFIDGGTCKFLELVNNNSKNRSNLYNVLNFCATRNGMNLLRSNILEPLISKPYSKSFTLSVPSFDT